VIISPYISNENNFIRSFLLLKWHRLYTKYLCFFYTCITCASSIEVIQGADFKYGGDFASKHLSQFWWYRKKGSPSFGDFQL